MRSNPGHGSSCVEAMGQALLFWREVCAQPWDIYEMKKCNFILIKTCVCGNRFRYVLVRAIGQQPINVNINLTFRLYVKIYGRFFKTNLVLQFSSYSDPSKEATGIPGNVSTKVLWSWTFRVKLSPQSPFGSQWPFRNRNSAGCRKRLINCIIFRRHDYFCKWRFLFCLNY